MSQTMGKQFTAGHDTAQLRTTVMELNSIGFGAMIDYLAEMKVDEEVSETEFDWNTQKIEIAIRETHINDNNSFALKFSALCNLQALKKASKVQFVLDSIFNPDVNDKKNEISYKQLNLQLKSHGVKFTQEEFKEFVELVKMEECNKIRIGDTLSIIEWRTNLGCLNIVNPEINENPIFQQIATFTVEDKVSLANLKKRLNSIFKVAFKRDLFIAIDAEQSYLQDAIRSIGEQYSYIHNDSNNHVVNTYQAYLKATAFNIEVECLKKEVLKSPICIKLVRGAYMVEESGLAEKYGYENPIHNTLEETHSCYDYCAAKITEFLGNDDKIVIATHNEASIQKLIERFEYQTTSTLETKNLYFAQLLGLGDHLSHLILAENFGILKYVPFGEEEIMFPYLLRRAQESKQMLAGVKLQKDLINDETMKRLGIKQA